MEINVSKLKEFGNVYKVLYVEDDEVTRTQTLNFLSRFFTQIMIAEDGEIGLQKYKEEMYDIVITDINMPHLNGIEMIEAIKVINEDQIIVVTSAHNDAQNLMELINLHIMHFVLKPFDFKKFLITLYKIVETLDTQKKLSSMQEEIREASSTAQLVVDMVDVGLVIMQEGAFSMANRAFLNMFGFDDFETLVLEMPEIGSLCQNFSHGICVDTNTQLIEAIKTRPPQDHRIRILKDNARYEYQMRMSTLNETNQRYLLSFTDVSELQQYLTQDSHTKLPNKHALMGHIEFLATTHESTYAYAVSLEHEMNVVKLFGQKKFIEIELNFIEKIQAVLQRNNAKHYIGHFSVNQFIIISEKPMEEATVFALKQLNFENNKKLEDEESINKEKNHLKSKVEILDINLNDSIESIEVMFAQILKE